MTAAPARRARPTRRLASVALVVVAAALAACGSEEDGGAIVGGGDTPVTSPPDTGGGGSGGGAGVGGALLVEPTPGLDNVVTAAIDSVAVIDPATLEVHFYNGVEPCYGVDHVAVVADTAESVTVEVGVGSNPDAGDVACVELAQLQGVRLALAGPLGERAVVDASTGQPVPGTSVG
jgi:hypothetical protein